MPFFILSIVIYHQYSFINFSNDLSLCLWFISYSFLKRGNSLSLTPYYQQKTSERKRENPVINFPPQSRLFSLSEGHISIEGIPEAFWSQFLPPYSHLLLFPRVYFQENIKPHFLKYSIWYYKFIIKLFDCSKSFHMVLILPVDLRPQTPQQATSLHPLFLG